MAEQTGIHVEAETVRAYLKEAEIVLSRPQRKISSPDPEYQAFVRIVKAHRRTASDNGELRE
jgi:hypothetical protein